MNKYKNIPKGVYKSKLEAYTAAQLAEANLPVHYEEIEIQLIPKFKFKGVSYERFGKRFKKIDNSRRVAYKPDFTSANDISKIRWVIEVKGMLTSTARLKWKLFKKFLNDKEYDWLILMPTNKREVREAINIILNNYEQPEG